MGSSDALFFLKLIYFYLFNSILFSASFYLSFYFRTDLSFTGLWLTSFCSCSTISFNLLTSSLSPFYFS